MVVQLETLKSLLGITWSSEDPVLQTILENAQGTVEAILWRPIEEAAYGDEEMDWHGESVLVLRHFPVASVSKLEFLEDGVWNVVGSQWNLNRRTWEILFPFSAVPRWFGNVRASYVAWYPNGSVPKAISQAIIEIASYSWNSRNSTGIKREKVDGSELEFSGTWPVTESVEKLLSPYRSYHV